MFRKHKDYYGNDVLVRGQITEEDIKKAEEVVVKMDIMQYEVGTTIVNQYQEIEAYVTHLKKQPVWESLERNTKIFCGKSLKIEVK